MLGILLFYSLPWHRWLTLPGYRQCQPICIGACVICKESQWNLSQQPFLLPLPRNNPVKYRVYPVPDQVVPGHLGLGPLGPELPHSDLGPGGTRPEVHGPWVAGTWSLGGNTWYMDPLSGLWCCSTIGTTQPIYIYRRYRRVKTIVLNP